MELEKFFTRNKAGGTKRIINVLSELDEKVNKYISKEEIPILDGTIDFYKKIVDKKHLPQGVNEISDILDDFSKLFKRSVLWETPGTLINITPPANIISIVAAFYTSLYNPNFAQDESSGYLMATELIVSKYLAEMVGWNVSKARGIFTFGGKGTNLYAIKIGIKKAIPNVIEDGINSEKIVVFSNEKGHPCHKEVCDWLGLGKKSCKRLPVDKNGQLDVETLEKELRMCLKEKKKIGGIILNGGTTNEIIIDPIKKVVDLRDKLVKEYNLDYIPHIHVDAVIGWAWLFFKYYNFEKNSLNMNREELKKIYSMKEKISQIKYADSFGADFHKTGFCPYISSIFMAKNFNDITGLGNKTDKGIDNIRFGEYSPFEYTLELTRSSIGPVSAYVAFETFGIEGFQKLIYNIFSNSEFIRYYLNSKTNFEVINMETEGIATLFIITPSGDNNNYVSYVSGDSRKLSDLLDYNYKFYLYCLKMLEEKKVHFKITFSKSYKPYGAKNPTGALKIYPTSPVVTKEEIKKCLDEIIETKKQYDRSNLKLEEDREIPVDYVYRD